MNQLPMSPYCTPVCRRNGSLAVLHVAVCYLLIFVLPLSDTCAHRSQALTTGQVSAVPLSQYQTGESL